MRADISEIYDDINKIYSEIADINKRLPDANDKAYPGLRQEVDELNAWARDVSAKTGTHLPKLLN